MGIILDLLTGLPLNAVLREQLAALEKKITMLEAENAMLKTKVATLEAENAELKAQIRKIEGIKAIRGDICPYCQQPAGKLLNIRPADNALAALGLKIRYYKCEGCGKEYDKEQEL